MNPVIPRMPLSPRELALLLFDWPMRESPRLALPLCILFAAIVQGGMIFLFSISYKTPSEPPPVAPQVYFLPPDSRAARQLAPWLEANDPAVFSPLRPAHDVLPVLPPLKYRPSYEEPPPPLRPLPPLASVVMEPLSLPLAGGGFGRHFRHRESVAPAPVSTPVHPPTTIRWEDDLAGRTPLETVAVSPPSAASSAAQPAVYQVGIGPEGIPRHCVLLESSGDPASDEAASVWIMARRFQPSETDSWGRVLVLWGASSSATVNTPPVTP